MSKEIRYLYTQEAFDSLKEEVEQCRESNKIIIKENVTLKKLLDGCKFSLETQKEINRRCNAKL